MSEKPKRKALLVSKHCTRVDKQVIALNCIAKVHAAGSFSATILRMSDDMDDDCQVR